ncbi:hypothetical protein KQ308_02510 [Synechococcus sp. CS-1327]|nr:hypothetical protein [Synechococcus sp. CS-1326]MCT0232385.1 hypothetical protein [Synechococcus sp. CS-1327]
MVQGGLLEGIGPVKSVDNISARLFDLLGQNFGPILLNICCDTKRKLIVSFAPCAPLLAELKRSGVVSPGPSKATGAFTLRKEGIMAAAKRGSEAFRIRPEFVHTPDRGGLQVQWQAEPPPWIGNSGVTGLARCGTLRPLPTSRPPWARPGHCWG